MALPRLYVLDEQGIPQPCRDMVRWAMWSESARENGTLHVAQDWVGPYWISTVFLGMDHNFMGGRPILWETMVFNHVQPEAHRLGGKSFEAYPDLDQERYHTRKEAQRGHARIVSRCLEIVDLMATKGEVEI